MDATGKGKWEEVKQRFFHPERFRRVRAGTVNVLARGAGARRAEISDAKWWRFAGKKFPPRP